MRRVKTNSLLPDGIGQGAAIAHKTGTLRFIIGDAGIIQMPNGKSYLASVLVQRPNHDPKAGDFVRELSRRVYNYLDNTKVSNIEPILGDASGGLRLRTCEVYIVDVKVQVEPGQKYFYPDVVVTCDERDDDPQLVQFPCLIIEVLSPSTEAADRGKKFAKYRQSPTLQEYVLVQVAQPSVEVFRRNEQGKWVLSEYNLDEKLRLESVDVEIAIAHLYRQVQFETEVTDA